jgi:dGTPase
MVGMHEAPAAALSALRAFNYEHIYTRPESVEQGAAVIAVLRALVEFFVDHPGRLPAGSADEKDPVHGAVAYVSGMTDRYAFDTAVRLLGWDPGRLPRGIDVS